MSLNLTGSTPVRSTRKVPYLRHFFNSCCISCSDICQHVTEHNQISGEDSKIIIRQSASWQAMVERIFEF